MLCIILIIFWIFPLNHVLAQQGQQIISLIPSMSQVKFGETLSIDIQYQVIDGPLKTSGVGFYIMFQSLYVESVQFTHIYPFGLVSYHEDIQKDIQDIDVNPLTDRFVSIAWISVLNDWPGDDQPLLLSKLKIQTKVTFNESYIRLSIHPISYAKEYVVTTNQAIIQNKIIPGDINNDGQLTIQDVIELFQCLTTSTTKNISQ